MYRKTKPKKFDHSRWIFTKSINAGDFDKLSDVVEECKDQGISLDNVVIDYKYDAYDEYMIDLVFCWDVEETDAEFNLRKAQYEKELEEYEYWKGNSNKIVEDEKALKKARKILESERMIRKLEKALKKAKEKFDGLQKDS